jgi:hypothetical protein
MVPAVDLKISVSRNVNTTNAVETCGGGGVNLRRRRNNNSKQLVGPEESFEQWTSLDQTRPWEVT